MHHVRLMTLLAICAFGITPLTACAGTTAQQIGSIAGATPTQVTSALNAAKKGLTAAHLGHEALADAYSALAGAGIVADPLKSQIRSFIDKSETALVAGDKLVALGDASGIEAQISTANSLVSQGQALVAQLKQ